MTCKEIIEFLADYLDGTLPWRQRLSFHVHLLFCQHCRQYLASYATTVRVTKSLGGQTEQTVEDIPDELVRAILSARRPRIGSEADSQSPDPGR